MLKVGDKIKCIKLGAANDLQLNIVYTVKLIHESKPWVLTDSNNFFWNNITDFIKVYSSNPIKRNTNIFDKIKV